MPDWCEDRIGSAHREARANVIDALRVMLSPLPGPGDDDGFEREALHLTIAA